MNKIKDFCINVKEYIRNIFKWSPILWKDRDWDDWFIFNALEFKIQKTKDYIALHQRYVGWEEDVSKMNIVIKLIQRVKEEYYSLECMHYYDKSYSFEPINDQLCELKFGEFTQNKLSLYFDKYKHSYKECYVEGKDDLYIAFQISKHNHEKAKRILFRLLDDNIEKWWD